MKINKLKSKINKTCFTHYNGTKQYEIGYILGIKGCKVAICEDCHDVQDIASPFFSLLMRFLTFLGLWNGAVKVVEEIDLSEEEL